MFKTPFICWCPQDCNTYVHCIGDRLWQFKADRNTRFICVNQLQMQCIQNYAAHLVTNTHKYDHIQPVLKHFHWLPVKQCIVFKIPLITYIAVHGLAPPPLYMWTGTTETSWSSTEVRQSVTTEDPKDQTQILWRCCF